jgi:hypothetical protein
MPKSRAQFTPMPLRPKAERKLLLRLTDDSTLILCSKSRRFLKKDWSSPKGAAQSNSSSEEGEGAKCRLLDFTQSMPSPHLWNGTAHAIVLGERGASWQVG